MVSFSIRKHCRTILLGKHLLPKPSDNKNALMDSQGVYFLETDVYLRRVLKQLHLRRDSNGAEKSHEHLHLNLHPNSPPRSFSLERMVRACRNNRRIRHVTVRVGAHMALCDYIDTDLPVDSDWWHEHDIRGVSQAIFSLPELESLEIRFDMEDSVEVLPFYQLFDAMDRCSGKLRRLHVDDMHLAESSCQTHLMGLARKFQGLPRLQELRLEVKSKRSEPIRLEEFWKVLSSMPTLSTVEISDRGVENYLMGGLTCQGSSLAQYIKNSSQLTSLKIREDSFQFWDEDVLQIAAALDGNEHLKSLEIVGVEGRKWSAQKYLSPKVAQAFLKVLERNYTLENLIVYSRNTTDYQQHYAEKISSVLGANKAGRGLLAQESYPTREQWLGTLVSKRKDVECSFRMLSANPSILLR